MAYKPIDDKYAKPILEGQTEYFNDLKRLYAYQQGRIVFKPEYEEVDGKKVLKSFHQTPSVALAVANEKFAKLISQSCKEDFEASDGTYKFASQVENFKENYKLAEYR